MNTSSTMTSAPPAPSRKDVASRPDHAQSRQRGEDFERLLREKSAARDEDEPVETGDEAGAAAPEGGPAAFLTWAAPPPLQRFGGLSDTGSGALDGAGGAGGATGKALRAALAGEQPAPPALAAAADAASTWQLTLREPLGAAVDVRASRNAQATHGWTLSIGSPTLDASVLARHAPRLNERLKARELSHTHARIEESDAQEPQ